MARKDRTHSAPTRKPASHLVRHHLLSFSAPVKSASKADIQGCGRRRPSCRATQASLLITLSIRRELFFTNEALSVSMPEDVRAAFPDAINYTSSEVPSAQSNARSATAELLHATLARRAFLRLDPVAALYPRSLGVPHSELPGLASLSSSGDFETDSSYRKQTESSQSNMIRPPQAVLVSY